MARIAAHTWFNAAQWSLLSSLRTTKKLAAAARDPRVAAELAHELGTNVAVVTDVARAVAGGVPLQQALATALEVDAEQEAARQAPDDDPEEDLRSRGADLLARSRDVYHEDEAGHPAYARIL